MLLLLRRYEQYRYKRGAMSLNSVKLTPYLLTQLYPNKLVVPDGNTSASPKQEGKPQTPNEMPAWKFLGNNEKKVLIGVHYDNAVHLPDAQLEFLMQLLKACQLSLNDVAVINLNNHPDYQYDELLRYFQSQVIFLFGLTAQQFGFPFEVPQYQIQQFANYTVLHAPALEVLQPDKAAKTQLWAALKKIFSL